MNNKTMSGIILVLVNYCLGASCSNEDVRPYPVPSQPVDKKFDISQKIADDWIKQYNESTKRDVKRIGEELRRKKLQQLVEEEKRLIGKFSEKYGLTPEQMRSISEKLGNLKGIHDALATCDTMINNFLNLKNNLESNNQYDLDTTQHIIRELVPNYGTTNFSEAKAMLADLVRMVEHIKQQIVLQVK